MSPVELMVMLGLGVPILGALAAIIVIRWRQTHLPWMPLPGHPGKFYCSETSTDAGRLAHAIDASVTALTQHTRWAHADIERALQNLHVHVKATTTWTEDTGDSRGSFRCAGLQMDSGVRVGCDLAALCHEIAHRVGQVVDEDCYMAHEGWADKGIYRAVETYGAALTCLTLDPHPV